MTTKEDDITPLDDDRDLDGDPNADASDVSTGDGADNDLRDEGEPGGDHPGFIRGRKEYRLRKRTENTLAVEREARIRAEERAATLERDTRRPADSTADRADDGNRRLTVQELDTDVKEGRRSVVEAMDILNSQRVEDSFKQRDDANRSEASASRQLDIASREITAYKELAPSLGTGEHPRFKDIAGEFRKLRGEGHPDDIRTEVLAIRTVLGPLDRFKKRTELAGGDRRRAGANHAESGGNRGDGGRRHSDPNAMTIKHADGKTYTVPQKYVEHWKRRGFDKANMEKEASYLSVGQLTV